MNSLEALARENRLLDDQISLGTDKGTKHSYLGNVYEPIFMNSASLKMIVEVGVFNGASLALWKLASPDANVIGFDIQHRELHPLATEFLSRGDISVVFCDAYQSATDVLFPVSIDLLIDDGPHSVDSQIKFLRLIQNLSPDGTLVIEDILGGYSVLKIYRKIPFRYRANCVCFTMAHTGQTIDDTVIVIAKSKDVLRSLQKKKKQLSRSFKDKAFFQWKVFDSYCILNSLAAKLLYR